MSFPRIPRDSFKTLSRLKAPSHLNCLIQSSSYYVTCLPVCSPFLAVFICHRCNLEESFIVVRHALRFPQNLIFVPNMSHVHFIQIFNWIPFEQGKNGTLTLHWENRFWLQQFRFVIPHPLPLPHPSVAASSVLKNSMFISSLHASFGPLNAHVLSFSG